MQRSMSDYKYAMSKWDNAETTLKLKVTKLENENKILVKKYQEIKEKNSELVCNYIYAIKLWFILIVAGAFLCITAKRKGQFTEPNGNYCI